MTAAMSTDGRCGSDGGMGSPRSHVCLCIRPAGHSLDTPRPHGCGCGAMWACTDCAEADGGSCAECGAAL